MTRDTKLLLVWLRKVFTKQQEKIQEKRGKYTGISAKPREFSIGATEVAKSFRSKLVCVVIVWVISLLLYMVLRKEKFSLRMKPDATHGCNEVSVRVYHGLSYTGLSEEGWRCSDLSTA